MTVCKLNIATVNEIEDAWSLAKDSDREKIVNMKWVSVESLQQWLTENMFDIEMEDHPSDSKIAVPVIRIEPLLGLLEQKEPFRVKASPKKQEGEENK